MVLLVLSLRVCLCDMPVTAGSVGKTSSSSRRFRRSVGFQMFIADVNRESGDTFDESHYEGVWPVNCRWDGTDVARKEGGKIVLS